VSADLLNACVASARRSSEERARFGASLVRQIAAARAPRGAAFRASLAAPGVRVIAECKRRSPSRGVIRHDYDPAAIARAYQGAGAAAISVLTEPTFFDGSLEHLRAVREAVSVPLLRKDFIVSEFQILEARASGADAVLLIVAALDPAELGRLIAFAGAEGLAALVEVHDRAELDAAVAAGAVAIGVNSRNLRTLEMAPAIFDELAPLLPAGVIAVAESGIRTAADIARLRALGFSAFLIGERFMGDADPGAALAAVRAAAERAAGERT
jgi:indole-3-glycerol phosphate synthase